MNLLLIIYGSVAIAAYLLIVFIEYKINKSLPKDVLTVVTFMAMASAWPLTLVLIYRGYINTKK